MENENSKTDGYKIQIPADFIVFKVKYPISSMENNLVFWDGEPAEFFSIAREMGSKFIYAYREKEKGQSGELEIEKDEFGFIVSGFFHVLSARIDSGSGRQIKNVNKSAGIPTEETSSNILGRDPEEIAKDMASFVRANLDFMSPDSFNLQYFFRKFWESHGINASISPATEQRRLMTRIENLATAKIKKL